jgi:hypothetical protein
MTHYKYYLLTQRGDSSSHSKQKFSSSSETSTWSIPVLSDIARDPSRSLRPIWKSGGGVRIRRRYSSRRGFDPSTCNRPGKPTYSNNDIMRANEKIRQTKARIPFQHMLIHRQAQMGWEAPSGNADECMPDHPRITASGGKTSEPYMFSNSSQLLAWT